MEFSKIAPYLQDTLVLIGFALLLFFSLCRAILKTGVIPQLSNISGYRILRQLLLYGFVLAIAIIILGFGLKYREMSHKDQTAAAQLVLSELRANRAVVGELAANTATILDSASSVAMMLRNPDAKLLSTLFPSSNIEPKPDTPTTAELARAALQGAVKSGATRNALEKRKFLVAARLIVATVERTRSTFASLADQSGERYKITREAWSAQIPHLQQVHVIDVAKLRAVYADYELTRSEYTVVAGRATEYLDALAAFLGPHDAVINTERLTRALTAERLFFVVTAAFARGISSRIERGNAALRAFDAAIDTNS